MGYADCGDDSKGRPIGYGFAATCDFPGCDAGIDRGLSYACGGEHGENEYSCERYFCSKHLTGWIETPDGDHLAVCAECEAIHSNSDRVMYALQSQEADRK